ncbi:hypothetical protein C0J52_12627 [Blattella germanica]|nr:hypothetical protein C0J52_12627 [Blattella germanica]
MLCILFGIKRKTVVVLLSIYFIVLSFIVILYAVVNLNKNKERKLVENIHKGHESLLKILEEIYKPYYDFLRTLIAMFVLHLIPNIIQLIYIHKQQHGKDQWNRYFLYKGRRVDLLGGCFVAQTILLIITPLAMLISVALVDIVRDEYVGLFAVKYIICQIFVLWNLYHYRQEIHNDLSTETTGNTNPATDV